MWMLLNLAVALRARKDWSELMEVLRFAVQLPEQDHTFQKLRLLLAMELAVQGETEQAHVHFRELGRNGWSGIPHIQYQLTQGLLAVQQAAADRKKRVFKAEFEKIQDIMAKYRHSKFTADYRRCLTKMAIDARQKWRLIIIWLGV